MRLFDEPLLQGCKVGARMIDDHEPGRDAITKKEWILLAVLIIALLTVWLWIDLALDLIFDLFSRGK